MLPREDGAVAISQLQKTMATLRLALAEIQDKERQLDAMIVQFRTQLRRLPRQVVYGGTGLEISLNAMAEVEERLADAEANRRRVLAIKKAALAELEALELVKQLDEARRSLADLKQRVPAAGEKSSTETEIRRLEQFIAEHSKRAEWAITASYEERKQAS